MSRRNASQAATRAGYPACFTLPGARKELLAPRVLDIVVVIRPRTTV